MSESREILVLGVGNILRRDDGVGVRVVGHLMRCYAFSGNVRLLDGGTFGRHLEPDIRRAERVIVIDTVCAGKKPGTITRVPLGADADVCPDNYVAPRGDNPPETTLIGLEPADREPWGTELTPAVAGVFREVVSMVLAEIRKDGGTYRPRRCRTEAAVAHEAVPAAS